MARRASRSQGADTGSTRSGCSKCWSEGRGPQVGRLCALGLARAGRGRWAGPAGGRAQGTGSGSEPSAGITESGPASSVGRFVPARPCRDGAGPSPAMRRRTSSTSSPRKRRWPPRVTREGSSPWTAHRVTVFDETWNTPAAWPGVRYSSCSAFVTPASLSLRATLLALRNWSRVLDRSPATKSLSWTSPQKRS